MPWADNILQENPKFFQVLVHCFGSIKKGFGPIKKLYILKERPKTFVSGLSSLLLKIKQQSDIEKHLIFTCVY